MTSIVGPSSPTSSSSSPPSNLQTNAINNLPISYISVKKTKDDGTPIHAGWYINQFQVEWQDKDTIDSTAINQYEEEFYLRVASRFRGLRFQRQEIANALKANKNIVTEQLSRKLFTSQRPTPQQIESRGIVPPGYFSQGHQKVLQRRHRRLSSTMDNMNVMLKMRPKVESVVEKGLAEANDLAQVYEIKNNSDEEDVTFSQTSPNNFNNNNNNNNGNNNNNNNNRKNNNNDNNNNDPPHHQHTVEKKNDHNYDTLVKEESWDISLTRSLLFGTVHEAVRKSLQQTERISRDVYQSMQGVIHQVNHLRDTLDRFSTQHINEQEEFQLRDDFLKLQMKLLEITERQTKVYRKLELLNQVERELIQIQNEYNHKLGQKRREEEAILERLQRTRAIKGRAERIKSAQRSHQDWAFTKLDYTLSTVGEHTKFLQNKINRSADTNNQPQWKEELGNNIKFFDDMKDFLAILKLKTENQQMVVKEYEASIENMESDLVHIRQQMSKIRERTFDQLYQLHKHIEIADALDFGQHRLSVATATDIEKERRHHDIKVQRDLATLQSQLREIDAHAYVTRLDEMIDVQKIMSNAKIKAFFSVFIQSFCQTLVDVDLFDRQMNARTSADANVMETLSNFYGVGNVLNTINSEISRTLDSKIKKVKRFTQILQNAILTQQRDYLLQQFNSSQSKKDSNQLDEAVLKNIKVKMEHLMLIAVFIGRKLSYHKSIEQEIDHTEQIQVTRLAEIRCRDIFIAIVNEDKIFTSHPHSIVEAAKAILMSVWGIEVKGDE